MKCQTKLWHPNISEEGDVCLSILRQSSLDGMGWAPTRKLKDVVWGLNSLFTVCIYNFLSLYSIRVGVCVQYTSYTLHFFQDLLNFDDPLNKDAADQFIKDKESFRSKVRDYVMQYAKR